MQMLLLTARTQHLLFSVQGCCLEQQDSQPASETPVCQSEQSLIKLMKADKITAQGVIAGGCLTGNHVPAAAAQALGMCHLKPVMTHI